MPEAAKLAADENDWIHSRGSTHSFLDALAEGVVVQDRKGLIVHGNDAALDLLGITRDQLLGRTSYDPGWGAVDEHRLPSQGDRHPASITLATGQPCTGVVMGISAPGRGRTWLTVNSRPLFDGDGALEGVVVSFMDITRQRAQERALLALNRASQALVRSTDEVRLLEDICSAVVDAGGYALAWVGVTGAAEHPDVAIVGGAGSTGYLYEGIVSASEVEESGLGPAGTALRSGTIQVANDLEHEPNFGRWRDRAREFGFEAMVSIPVTIGPGATAVLNIYSADHHAFDAAAVRVLAELAAALGFGITHLRSAALLSVALEGTIAAIAGMTETRDPYTAGHQEHVGALAAAIAARLGLDETAVDGVRLGGLVHDVGKIAVPAEILTRPGRLDPLEQEMVRRHAELGADILGRAQLPWPIAEVALQHHERLDGSGYPSGLVGDRICLPARIVAVADVVEAMAHHRPYRPAPGLGAALSEVRAGAGTTFDADVVDACIDAFNAGFTFDP